MYGAAITVSIWKDSLRLRGLAGCNICPTCAALWLTYFCSLKEGGGSWQLLFILLCQRTDLSVSAMIDGYSLKCFIYDDKASHLRGGIKVALKQLNLCTPTRLIAKLSVHKSIWEIISISVFGVSKCTSGCNHLKGAIYLSFKRFSLKFICTHR